MKHYSSNAKSQPDLWAQIQQLLDSEDVLKFEKVDTAAAMYLLNKIGYDEVGANETIILAAAKAIHEIISVFFSIKNREAK